MSSKTSRVANIVAQLKAASHAYYETGEPIIDDDTYDALLEELRSLDAGNPYLVAVGAPVSEGAVRLPIPMPSLRNVKPDSGLDTWVRSYPGPWVASDKLDGISALWIPDKGALYLRGNGLVGQDVSHLVGLGIQGLVRPKKGWHNGPWRTHCSKRVRPRDTRPFMGKRSTPSKEPIKGRH